MSKHKRPNIPVTYKMTYQDVCSDGCGLEAVSSLYPEVPQLSWHSNQQSLDTNNNKTIKFAIYLLIYQEKSVRAVNVSTIYISCTMAWSTVRIHFHLLYSHIMCIIFYIYVWLRIAKQKKLQPWKRQREEITETYWKI